MNPVELEDRMLARLGRRRMTADELATLTGWRRRVLEFALVMRRPEVLAAQGITGAGSAAFYMLWRAWHSGPARIALALAAAALLAGAGWYSEVSFWQLELEWTGIADALRRLARKLGGAVRGLRALAPSAASRPRRLSTRRAPGSPCSPD